MKKLLSLIIGCVSFFVGPVDSFAAGAPSDNTVYFYNWTEYVPPGLLQEFTHETGIKVVYSTYDSNEAMYAKLKTNKNSGYDLIVPSTYFISRMRQEGMLKRIDKSKTPNFKAIDPSLLHKSFDPNNDYSIPYIWGATGIAVDTDVVDPSSVKSWADLWDPKYRGKLIINDDAREVFAIALHKLGYSGNTRDPKQIKAAYEELKKLMPNILAFNSDNPATPFIEGEAGIGAIWNGSTYVARQAGIPMQFIWPQEGGIFWMDSLAIPANAHNVDGALKLINFLLRPDVAARIAEAIGYPTPSDAAKALLPKALKEDPSLYPTKKVLAKGEWQDDVGQANTLYEEYFQKLKMGS